MRRYPLNILSGLFLAGTLAGCASPAVFMASQAVTGVSYLTTGKGTTDHVLSAAMAEDCALHRAINGDAVCRSEAEAQPLQTASLGEWPPIDGLADEDEAEIAAARTQLAMAGAKGKMAAASPQATQVTGLGADMFFVPHASGGRTGPIVRNTPAVEAPVASDMAAAPVVASSIEAGITPAAGPAPVPDSAEAEAKAQPEKKRFYLVIGSFSSRANALRAAERAPADASVRASVRVVTAHLPQKTVYRVVVGPFDQKRTKRTQRQLAAAGGKSSWPVPACDGQGTKGCIVTD